MGQSVSLTSSGNPNEDSAEEATNLGVDWNVGVGGCRSDEIGGTDWRGEKATNAVVGSTVPLESRRIVERDLMVAILLILNGLDGMMLLLLFVGLSLITSSISHSSFRRLNPMIDVCSRSSSLKETRHSNVKG